MYAIYKNNTLYTDVVGQAINIISFISIILL